MSENVSAERSAQASAAGFGGKGLNIGIAVAAVVTVIGLALWGMQLVNGFMDTGMRDFAPWGLSLASFMFFVGLSVGSMALAAFPKAAGSECFGGIAKVATWLSICSTVLAIGFVVVDLGQPLRLWELFIYSNLGSPLMWDIIVLSVYLIVSVVFLWTLLRAEKGEASAKAVRLVAGLACAAALIVCVVDGWIFGLMPAREMWNTALLAPWFVSSALASGTALVLAASFALDKAGYVSFGGAEREKLAKLMGAFVLVDLLFFVCDLVTEAFGGSAIAPAMLSGQLAPFFWIQIAGYAVALAVCFAPKLRTAGLAAAAAVLVCVGIFCKRLMLIDGGFQFPAHDLATFVTSHTVTTDWGIGLAGAYQGMMYAPTLPEIGLALGVFALGALMLLVGLKFLPLQDK